MVTYIKGTLPEGFVWYRTLWLLFCNHASNITTTKYSQYIIS